MLYPIELRGQESRPISRVLSWTIIHLRYVLPHTCSDLPGITTGRRIDSLFGLAPSGVCPAKPVASLAVRSYRTISPLPLARRYIFCGTFRQLALPGRYPALCPVEPGLSSRAKRAIVWPAQARIVRQNPPAPYKFCQALRALLYSGYRPQHPREKPCSAGLCSRSS